MMPGYPTAHQVALAIVEACKRTGDKPIATCMRQPSRARLVAMAALSRLYPDTTLHALARCCGHPTPPHGSASLVMARKSSWWRSVWIDEIVDTLVDANEERKPK